MRISIATQAAPWELQPRSGLYNLRIASALNAMGHEAHVFVCSMKAPGFLEPWMPKIKKFNGRPDHYTYEGVQFHTLRGYLPHPMKLRDLHAPKAPRVATWPIRRAFVGQLGRRLAEFKPDFMLFTDGVCLGPVGNRIHKRLGIPWGTVDHDPFLFDPASKLGKFYRETLEPASLVCFVAEKYANHARDRLGLKQAVTIYNGTQFPKPEQWTTPRPAKWDGKRVIFSVGDFIPRKAHDLLIKGFAQANIPDAHLVIVGTPPPAHLTELVTSLHLQGRVEFIDYMPHQQIPQHMIWSDLFALPSWDESFGLVYVEALAAETPVILCDDCGLAGTLKHGEHGWVLPIKNVDAIAAAIREAFTTADLDRMGNTGRALVESKFTWENVAKKLVESIEAAKARR